ncbi:MAG: diguanylate cyclase [Actinobacteria bacterium]|nr:diguanylate cyclase [Actinomycetota bacterium]
MVDRRALLGLLSGLAGLAAGVGATVLERPALGAAAAACCLVTTVAALLLLNRAQDAERRVAGAAAAVKLLDLPTVAREEATSLVDPETRLPDDRFFELAVEGRVAAARRHLWPVTVVLLEIGVAADAKGHRPQADAVAAFGRLIQETLRESDIACRVGPLTFGLVLEDTAEEGGVWTAERLQIALAQDVTKVRRVAAGVASYPTHGLTADDVLARSQAALTRACAAEAGRGLGQVEVAQADLA